MKKHLNSVQITSWDLACNPKTLSKSPVSEVGVQQPTTETFKPTTYFLFVVIQLSTSSQTGGLNLIYRAWRIITGLNKNHSAVTSICYFNKLLE